MSFEPSRGAARIPGRAAHIRTLAFCAWGAVVVSSLYLVDAHAGRRRGLASLPPAMSSSAPTSLRVSAPRGRSKPVRQPAQLAPRWSGTYQVWKGQSGLWARPNDSYLERRERVPVKFTNPLTDQLGEFMDPGQASGWRAEVNALHRSHEARKAAGLSSLQQEAAYQGAISSYGGRMVDEYKRRKIQEAGQDAVVVVTKSGTPRAVLYSGAVVAGLYIGRPARLRLTDDTHLLFRTSLRDRYGQLELHSRILNGSFEYHPQAAESYALGYPTGVDFGAAMDFGKILDFGAERYQFRLARDLPFLDLQSSVLYGSSSNAFASSISRQLTPRIAAVVDSIYYLSPVSSAGAMEERVRLKYELRF